MTKTLKEGENLYKFTDREIQLITNCLSDKTDKIAELSKASIIPSGVTDMLRDICNEIQQLQFSIEQQEHNL